MSDYYVYVYIDPRNFEEFYFGKGLGSRKRAHLFDESDSEKARRIKAIRRAGLEPTIRVIAQGLSEHDALLVEKTLLWKLGKQLTNVSSGHYANKFRPHNTLHQKLSGFDFQNGIYYYNVGEGESRNWDDYRRFGFISAGQGKRWRDGISSFQVGDVFAAYLKRRGYVGVGTILKEAVPVRVVTVNNIPLLSHDLVCKGLSNNVESDELCEYVCEVQWEATVERNNAKWKTEGSEFKPYTTTHIRASLDGQQETIDFLCREFNLDIRALIE